MAGEPQIGQRRAGMKKRRPSPITDTIIQPSELSQKIPGASKIETRITNSTNSTSPVHSVNNTNEGMTQRRILNHLFSAYLQCTSNMNLLICMLCCIYTHHGHA